MSDELREAVARKLVGFGHRDPDMVAFGKPIWTLYTGEANEIIALVVARCADVARSYVDPVDPTFAAKRPDEAILFEDRNDTARRIAAAIGDLSPL